MYKQPHQRCRHESLEKGLLNIKGQIAHVLKKYSKIKETSDETDIFIYPGFNFSITDALITNFHLPKSTLIMLVCAFAGKDCILNAYKTAVENKQVTYK